jgi:hypothetical protein
VIGQIGRGKSALVKSYLWRQLVFGRQACVIDPTNKLCHGLQLAIAKSQGTRLGFEALAEVFESARVPR